MHGHLIFCVSSSAQSRVDAKDILKSIDEGKAINCTGAEIVVDLDLTTIQDMEPDKNNKRSRNSTKLFRYHVRSPLTFEDCTFKGSVIAYYHDDKKNETHIAIFHDDTSFQGCEFQGVSAFKYSKFHEGADFAKTTFHKEALFKYTEFYEPFDFEGTEFEDSVDFKYTKLEGKSFTKYLLKNRK